MCLERVVVGVVTSGKDAHGSTLPLFGHLSFQRCVSFRRQASPPDFFQHRQERGFLLAKQGRQFEMLQPPPPRPPPPTRCFEGPRNRPLVRRRLLEEVARSDELNAPEEGTLALAEQPCN